VVLGVVDWDVVAKVTSAIAGTAAVVTKVFADRSAAGRRRAEIKSDVELMNMLPLGNPSRELLDEHVRLSIERLVRRERERRRDASGVVLGLVLIVLGLVFARFAVNASAWWWLAAAPFGALGAYGAMESGARRRRDERGHVIPEGPQSSS